MIYSVKCDQPSFKKVEFAPGFNVILADRTKESTKKQSRNSLGKSTLIEIIHFCLGADFTKCKSLQSQDLLDWTFYLEFDLSGQRVVASRNTSSATRVFVDADATSWPIAPDESDDDGKPSYDWKKWNYLLGILMFGLRLTQGSEKNCPTFRSLISYFIRRNDDAFASPFEHHGKQQPWDSQVNTAFLIGLDWEIARDFQIVKTKEKTLKNLKQATALGYLESLVGKIGKLESERVRLRKKTESQSENLQSFRVIEQYRELEQRADQLTVEIHDLQNANVRDQQMLTRYESSLEEETAPSDSDVESLYNRIGVELPGLALKRLQEVTQFHKRVVDNRRRFLESEVTQLTRGIEQRRSSIDERINERSELLLLLKSGGALDEYTRLQRSLGKDVASLNEVESRIRSLKQIERGQSDLKIEKEMLQQRARIDFDERAEVRERALLLFGMNSEALHEKSGQLVIDVGNTGLKFRIDIEGSGGTGVDKTSVFSYDLMLAQLWSERSPSPGFLIHDSSMFDGVDERQRARSLELAAGECEERGFQYICTFNSDLLPKSEFTPGFNIDEFVTLTLTDKNSSGTLTGIRFRLKSPDSKDESVEED